MNSTNGFAPGSASDVIPIIADEETQNLNEPLVNKVHLFDTFVVGTSYIKNQSLFKSLRIGDTLSLRRETNEFDKNAIIILNEEKKKVGYIPEKDNAVFARLMDAGKFLSATISDIEFKGSYTQITIGIFLADF